MLDVCFRLAVWVSDLVFENTLIPTDFFVIFLLYIFNHIFWHFFLSNVERKLGLILIFSRRSDSNKFFFSRVQSGFGQSPTESETLIEITTQFALISQKVCYIPANTTLQRISPNNGPIWLIRSRLLPGFLYKYNTLLGQPEWTTVLILDGSFKSGAHV